MRSLQQGSDIRRIYLAIALGALALHLACGSDYGWFRDEMYFLACGRRLAWGYVDQPPLIALVSRISYAISGQHVWLYRLPAALAHAATVVLVGLFTHRQKGGPFAVAVACVCVALAPGEVAEGGLLTMNAFELPLYLALVLVVLEGRWAAAGVLTGIGILNKHSFALYAVCLLAAVLLDSRLRTRRILLAPLVAAVIVLPHAIWQVRNGFPMLELLAAQKWKNAPWTLSSYLGQQLLEMNPLALPIVLAGLWLAARELRTVAIAFLLEELLFGALKGKAYYVAPAFLPLFAMGGIAAERIRSRWRAAIPAAIGASGLALSPLVVPILPPAALERWEEILHVAPPQMERQRLGPLPQHLADQFGWSELSQAVSEAAARLAPQERAHAGVFGQNYGEAAALELLGSGGLPVFSAHNAYWMWGPPPGVDTVLIVGGRLEDHLRNLRECRVGAHEKDVPWAMPYERARTIFICSGLRAPIAEIWASDKHYE
ncbi:MAG: glycosyltransferase family 39 protein [Myxococcales bacterium]|nr:glycosyltransferase family 39 protein [Myxococcales bacterium]